MIVISLTNVPQRLKGYLTKYLWEISTGVFVGSVNARIRSLLWNRICDNTEDVGKAIMVYQASNEQGFDFEVIGSSWVPVDYEGLKLIMRPKCSIQDNSSDQKDDEKNTNDTGEYVMIDLETTGIDPVNDEILEIGAIRIVDGEEREVFERIIKVSVPGEIAELTGITQEMANEGKDKGSVLNELKAFIQDSEVVGYNIRMFDIRFLKKAFAECEIGFPIRKIVDVMDCVRHTFPNIDSYRLRDVSNMLGVEVKCEKHRAVEDCRICREVYRRCRR